MSAGKVIGKIIIEGIAYDLIKKGGQEFVVGLDKFVEQLDKRYEVRYERGIEEPIQPSPHERPAGPPERPGGGGGGPGGPERPVRPERPGRQ